MLRRIRLEGYKSFRSIEVALRPLCVLVGPNGSGKTNFIDALYLISRLATLGPRERVADAFEPPHRGYPLDCVYRGPASEPTAARIDFEVDVQISDATAREVASAGAGDAASGDQKPPAVRERMLRWELGLQVTPSGDVRVVEENVRALRKRGTDIKKSRRAFVETTDGQVRLRAERQSHPWHFPTELEHTVLARSHDERYYPHLAALQRELGGWRSYYLEPRQVMREPSPPRKVDWLRPRGEGLAAFLWTLRERGELDDFNRHLRRLLGSGVEIELDTVRGELEVYLLEPERLRLPARVVSEGTLRIVGLLAALWPSSAPRLVAFEEPENGLHPARVELAAELLVNASEQMQVVVTTHSPHLAEALARRRPESLFRCRKTHTGAVIESMAETGLFRAADIADALRDAMVSGLAIY